MFKFLLPKEGSFFNFFEDHIALVIQACNKLHEIASNNCDISEKISQIKDLEHKTDKLTHGCIDALHKTFITPFDRSDIHRLIKRLDDIIDCVDGATTRMAMYEIRQIRSEVKEIAEILIKSTTEIQDALRNLRNLKNPEKIDKNCVVIHELEHDGDIILRKALVRLFAEEKDTVMVIKWKEIFEILEHATDRCEDVANVIQGVVIEAS